MERSTIIGRAPSKDWTMIEARPEGILSAME
jgi:hypothetical protein